MKLKITNAAGLPVPDATVMVTEAPVPIHDIAAMTDASGTVNLADYIVPGKYTVVISHDGDSSVHSIDLQGATNEVALTV